MADQAFDVDPEVLRTQGHAFVNIGTEFGKAAKKLKDDLEGLGKPWEDADFGAAFDVVYTPIRDGMFTSMDSLGERIEDIGDKLQGMARTYTASDAEGVHVVSSVPRPAV